MLVNKRSNGKAGMYKLPKTLRTELKKSTLGSHYEMHIYPCVSMAVRSNALGSLLSICKQGWRQEFSDGGLTLPTRGLICGFQGTTNAKNLRKNRFSPSDGGLACSNGGL